MTTTRVQTTSYTPVSIALLTAGYLTGGIVVGMGLGALIGAQAHMVRNVLASLVALTCMTAAGSYWARALARRLGRLSTDDLARAGRAGAMSFGPVMISVALILTALEPILVSGKTGPVAQIHVVYGFLFVPGAFVVAGLTTWIMTHGLALTSSNRRSTALAVGAASGFAYLAVYLVMDAAGWRVGAPGAAKRATMLVVSALSALGATLAAGAVLGRSLIRRTAAWSK